MNVRAILLSISSAAALAAFAGPAQAATQALALITSDGAIQLDCQGRDCWAEFSSFCLQPKRRSPDRDTAYDLADNQELRLLGERADGSQIVLDAAKELRITALRTHVAVRVNLPRARLNELNLSRVTLEVGRQVALLPRPHAGEPAMSRTEVRHVTTVLRQKGSRIVDENTKRMQSVRLVNRMINALPAGGRVAGKVRDALWQQSLRPERLAKAAPSSQATVRRIYDDCRRNVELGQKPSLRRCLESHHDSILGTLNDDYWAAVRTGS